MVQVLATLEKAHCVRCGQQLELLDEADSSTQITAPSSSMQAPIFESSTPLNSRTGSSESYATWSEFRMSSQVVQQQWMELATRPLPDLRGVGLQSLPPDLPPGADELGLPLASFTVPGERRMTSLILGVILLLGGLGIGLLLQLDWHPFVPRAERSGHLIMAILGMVETLAGLWILLLRRPVLAVDFWIFENGLLWQRGGRLQAGGWEEIEEWRGGLEKGRRRFWMILLGKLRVVVDVNENPAMMPLQEYLEIKLTAARFISTLSRLCDGERVKFGVITLDRQGLSSPRFRASWTEILRVVPDREWIYVQCRQLQDWHPVRSAGVAFPLLLLALCHVMIEENGRLPPALSQSMSPGR